MNRLLAVLVLCLSVAGCVSAQQQELSCFIMDPDAEGPTNIRAKPGGKVVYQVDPYDFDCCNLTVVVQPGGWWRIKGPLWDYESGMEVEIPAREAWIHRSVLALATDNFDGQWRVLRTEPRADAPKAGTVTEFTALLRPLDLSADGKWVQVCYEPTDLTGWIEVSRTRTDRFEKGDGFDFPTLHVSAAPAADVPMLSAPGKGEKTFVLGKGKTYGMMVAHPDNGWWQLIDGYVSVDDDDVLVVDESWVRGADIYLRVVKPKDQGTVPVYASPDEASGVVASLKPGMVVHPLDLGDEEDWARWVRIAVDGHPELGGWVQYTFLDGMP